MARRASSKATAALRDAAAASTMAEAGAAAHEALAAHGSATDAVIAGFFAAAGADPGVLIGGAAAIVSSGGTSARAVDGSPVQPGRGAARPRGFRPEDAVPGSAYVGVPRALASVVWMHAYGGRLAWRDVVRPGIAAAEEAGARGRARVLREAAHAGPLALREAGVVKALVEVGGALAGGTLTEADFEAARPEEREALLRPLTPIVAEATSADAAKDDDDARGENDGKGDEETASGSGIPWDPADRPRGTARWITQVIAACDRHGGLAVLVCATDAAGVPLLGEELRAPRAAVPVARGVTRIAPGTPLACPAPLALVRAPGLHAAIGFAADAQEIANNANNANNAGAPRPLWPSAPRPEALGALLGGAGIERLLANWLGAIHATSAAAAIRTGRTARPILVRGG